MSGLLITFEGTEGGGKSTQIALLADKLHASGRDVRLVREPGGTPIGEEIRHTLKYSPANHAMTAEAELLLMNASRAQLVREVIRPALAAGAIILCDRFFDSTVAYQGYGRGLDLGFIQSLLGFVVGETRPALTLLLDVPLQVSETRRQARVRAAQESSSHAKDLAPLRDRMEEADSAFFQRVESGFAALAQAEPRRIKVIDATQDIPTVTSAIWRHVEPLLA